MSDLNVLIPEKAWTRVGAFVEAIDQVNPLLFDAQGRMRTVTGGEVDLPVHLAWHNFEIARDVYRQHSELLLRSPTLRFVQTAAAGLDAPVFRQLVERGVTLCNSDSQALSIAEYVLASLLNTLHDFPGRRDLQNNGNWQRHPFRELSGMHCLVVGYGHIGQRIVDRLRAFEAKVTVLRRKSGDLAGVAHVGSVTEIEDLLPTADVIILACALNDQTQKLINSNSLSRCLDGCILINIARGGLVDEGALCAALDSGKVGHAVLDVFEKEPLPADHRFWNDPRVTLSAHTSNSGSGRERRGDHLFLDNLAAFVQDRPLRNLVSREYFVQG